MARPPGLEQRTVRHRLRLRVTIGGGSAIAVNASRGGVCIEQARVLPVGARIQGSIWLDGRDLPFVGHVAWAATGEHRLNQSGRMGVRFESISPAFAVALDRHATRSPFRDVPGKPPSHHAPGSEARAVTSTGRTPKGNLP